MSAALSYPRLECYTLQQASQLLSSATGQNVDENFLIQLALDCKISLVIPASFGSIIFMCVGDGSAPERLSMFLEGHSTHIYFELSLLDLAELKVSNKFRSSFYKDFYYKDIYENFRIENLHTEGSKSIEGVHSHILDRLHENCAYAPSFYYSRIILPNIEFLFAFSEVETGLVKEFETFLEKGNKFEIGVDQVAILYPELVSLCQLFDSNKLKGVESNTISNSFQCEEFSNIDSTKLKGKPDWVIYALQRAPELMIENKTLTNSKLGKIIANELKQKRILGARGTTYVTAETVVRELSGKGVTGRKPNGK